MGKTTSIGWTDHTFNPWWGCVRVSPGCEHCYAETFAKRVGQKVWGPESAQVPRRFFGDKHWAEPLAWNAAARAAGKRARVFCASMADVFEDRRDLDAQRERLFRLIEATPALDWLLLTKRPENMVQLARAGGWDGEWPANVWGGATVEDQQRAEERVPELLQVRARVHFLSMEPLLKPVTLHVDWLSGHDNGPCPKSDPGCDQPEDGSHDACSSRGRIDWIILGGESGGRARDFDLGWARTLAAQAKAYGTAVFVKQLGARPVTLATRSESLSFAAGPEPMLMKLKHRKGEDSSEWPADLQVQEWPQ